MEERIFKQLYTLVRHLGKTHCFRGKWFSDAAIVTAYLWAILWDRLLGLSVGELAGAVAMAIAAIAQHDESATSHHRCVDAS
jgi:hypothetical protein